MNEENVSKRDLLKKMAIATSVPLANTGKISAKSPNQSTENGRNPVEEQYLTQEALESAVQAHADGLLRELVNQSLLTSSSVDNLPLNQFDDEETHLPPDETERKVAVTSVPMEEGQTALIMISEDTPTDSIGIYIQPEAQKAYAFIHPKEDQANRYKIDYTSNEITIQDEYCDDKTVCDTGNWCNGGCDSSCGYYWEIEYECYRCDDVTQTDPCCCDEIGKTCGNNCYCCYSDCPC